MGKLGWFMSKTSTLTSPPREGGPAGTEIKEGTGIEETRGEKSEIRVYVA